MNVQFTARAIAPVRVLDLGGWSDTRFAKHGAVLNMTVDRYAHVILSTRPTETKTVSEYGQKVRKEATNRTVSIHAPDLGQEVVIDDPGALEYDGRLDLLKGAIRLMGVKGGLEITAWADAPPACGTGTSASMAVAMIAALDRLTPGLLTPYEIAELSQRIEVEELGLECGVQDQHAAAAGGINLMDIEYPRARIYSLKVDTHTVDELNERLVLVYVGPRLSDTMHHKVIENYEAGDSDTLAAINRLRQIPLECAEDLQRGKLKRVAEFVNENWDCQKRLHADMTTDLIEDLGKAAFGNGAMAMKANGAGGGGSVVFLVRPGWDVAVRDALNGVLDRVNGEPSSGPVPAILPCHLTMEGVRSWVARQSDEI